MKHFGMPGPGGSLGKCAVCGDSFAAEVLLGRAVQPFSIAGIEQMLYAHDKCVKVLNSVCEKQEWRDLPDGPLREAFARQEGEVESK